MNNPFEDIGKQNGQFMETYLEEKFSIQDKVSLEEFCEVCADNLLENMSNSFPMLVLFEQITESKSVFRTLIKAGTRHYFNKENCLYQVDNGMITKKKWRLD